MIVREIARRAEGDGVFPALRFVLNEAEGEAAVAEVKAKIAAARAANPRRMIIVRHIVHPRTRPDDPRATEGDHGSSLKLDMKNDQKSGDFASAIGYSERPRNFP